METKTMTRDEQRPPAPGCCSDGEAQARVRGLRARCLPEREAEGLAEVFTSLGDRTRVRILDALCRDELCVCDLAEVLDMTVSAVSHQLRLLRAARLVAARRDGRRVWYRLDDEHVRQFFEVALEHLRHE